MESTDTVNFSCQCNFLSQSLSNLQQVCQDFKDDILCMHDVLLFFTLASTFIVIQCRVDIYCYHIKYI